MSNGKAKNVVEEVSSIGKDAEALVAELQPKAQQDKNLTQAELKKIDKLVKRSEAAMSAANVRAKETRKAQIAELEKLVKSIDLSLSTPGLTQTTINDLKKLKRNKLAQLTRLEGRAALDFGGLLSPTEIKEIATVLQQAKKAVASKKKAAAFLGSILKIANFAISIVAKLGS